ncbi:MAG: type II toxin-antitoxin system VapB family antitoxin [Spirochaetaceae bacterium]|nr:type II toxin-antitoxin system VapB family antitoxin [Spirochaetaceae bacterium]
MKTTIDIPDIAIFDLMNFTHVKTKREAVLKAINEYNQKHKMIHLAKMLGTLEYFMDNEDLEVMRAQD